MTPAINLSSPILSRIGRLGDKKFPIINIPGVPLSSMSLAKRGLKIDLESQAPGKMLVSIITFTQFSIPTGVFEMQQLAS